MRVLGIDPGTAACGYGVVIATANTVRPVDFGCFSTSPNETAAGRLAAIYDAVAGLIADHGPDAVAVEESYVGADPRTALSVGQARGAILVACAKGAVDAVEYPPSTIKQSVCGSGRAGKQQVQRMVGAMLGLEKAPTPHHAADALAVAICHALGSPLLTAAGGAA
ncbi:MAG: crossover junction endodeoxyribonuclease RuvC [Gaiellales bacterium]